MKLGEYVSRILSMKMKLLDDTGNSELDAEMELWEKNKLRAEFIRVYGEIQYSLGKNKELLGVHKRSGWGPDKQEVLKKREIDPVNLKRHLLAVWNDVGYDGRKIIKNANSLNRHENPETIKAYILNELAAVLGFKDSGEILNPDGSDKNAAESGYGGSKQIEKAGRKADVPELEIREKKEPGLEWWQEPLHSQATVKLPKNNDTAAETRMENKTDDLPSGKKKRPARSKYPRKTMPVRFANPPPQGTAEYESFMADLFRYLYKKGKII